MKKEQLQTAIELLPQTSDGEEMEIVMNWIKQEVKGLNPANDESLFFFLLKYLNQNVRNNTNFYYESNKIFAELLTKSRFLSKIESAYLNPNKSNALLAIETLYCIGYLLEYNKKTAKRIHKLVAKNPDLAIFYLYNQESSAMMLQLLFSLNKHSNKLWKHEKSIKTIIRDFLFSGHTEVAQLIAALQPIELKGWNNNPRFNLYLLQLMGFNKNESYEIIDTWKDVYDLVDTFTISIIQNVLSLIFLEAEREHLAVLMHQIYGIKTFARYEVEQYISQFEVYTKAIEGFKKPYVLHFGIDNDNSGALLGKQETLWAATAELLHANNFDFIVSESGKSLENILQQIESIVAIHGKAEQIIFSIHASEKGFQLYFESPEYEYNSEKQEFIVSETGKWIYITKEKIKNILVPALKRAISENGTVLFNICKAGEFQEVLSELNCFIPDNDRNILLQLNRGTNSPLVPTYQSWTEEEYSELIKKYITDSLQLEQLAEKHLTT